MNLPYLTTEVCKIAKETGSFIAAEANRIQSKDIEFKSRNNMVSYVDKEAEKKLCTALSALLPKAGFLTEEDTVENSTKKYTWVIDPLDGTTNYIHHIPVFSISIALMKKEEILLGVVYEINQNECFYAWKDGGAFLNGKSIKVCEERDFSHSLFAIGFPFSEKKKVDYQAEFIAYLIKNSRGIRRLGSAAVDLCYVACGRFDAFFEFDLNPWDVAAGSLILTEANGCVSDFSEGNNYIFGKEILASQKGIYEETLKQIQSFMHIK
jgi:myo-inositol-1(or 4)-monophosphatase